jgi:phosphate transport system substrate-binding protein
MVLRRLTLTAPACALLGGWACDGSGSTTAAVVELRATGARVPAPLYDRWSRAYTAAHPGVRVDYRPVGTGGGIVQFTTRTVDARGSAAATDEEPAQVDQGAQLLPMAAGSVVLSYNLPGATAPLRLSRRAYAGIFLGAITRWNDPAIAASNPGMVLPDLNISVVHRGDSNGTTFVFTLHLAAISAEWAQRSGASTSPRWPAGVGASGGEGVTSAIRQTPGALGYLEYAQARQSHLPMAVLENRSGAFVAPTTASGQAALAANARPAGTRLFLPDPEGAEAYPIVTYTWLLLYKEYDQPETASTLKDVVRYCLGEGQRVVEETGYIPLPASMLSANVEALDNMQ